MDNGKRGDDDDDDDDMASAVLLLLVDDDDDHSKRQEELDNTISNLDSEARLLVHRGSMYNVWFRLEND